MKQPNLADAHWSYKLSCSSLNAACNNNATSRKRYTGRAARFDWACKNADSVLFVRTGVASRGEVCDLLLETQVGRIYMRPTKRAKKQQAAIAGRKTSNWSGSVVKFYIWGQGWRNAFQVFLFLVWRAMSLWVMNSCSSCRGSKSDMLAALAILAILAPRQSYFWSQNKKLQSSAAWRTSRIFEKASIPTGVDHYI